MRFFAEQETKGGRDKLEIIIDLMRRPNGATVDDVIAITGWPIEIVRSTLSTLTGLVAGGQEQTRINENENQKIYRIVGWDDSDSNGI